MIKYPACHYSIEGTAEDLPDDVMIHPTIEDVAVDGDDGEEDGEEDNERGGDSDDEDIYESDDDIRDDEDGIPGLSPNAVELLEDEIDEFSEDDTVNNEEEEPTEAQMKAATDTAYNEIITQIIEDADKEANMDREREIQLQQCVDDDLQIDEIPANIKFKTVLGDIFHFMDRAKVPTHHEFKGLFFQALRAAIFIMNKDDVDDVKIVLASKDISWESKMAFDFSYISQRVRRKVPSPDILYFRVKAVFEFFKDKKDTTTGTTLFTEKNKKKS